MNGWPLDGKKIYDHRYHGYQWVTNNGANNSFNDQPSWVRYNPISRKVISLAWESEDSAIKGQLYRGYNKPYYIRPLDKRIEFDHNSTSNDEILHPDYRNKDFVITYSIGPRRRSTVL